MTGTKAAALNSSWILIEAKDAKDALNQIRNVKAKNSEKEVGNILFASHGSYDNASFSIGDEKFDNSKLKSKANQAKIKGFSELDIKGSVIIQACFAGGFYNKGNELLAKVAKLTNTDVYGNQSWGVGYSSMNQKEEDGFFFWQKGEENSDNSHYQILIPSERDVKKFKNAIMTAGAFTYVNKSGVMKEIPSLFYNTDGTFGIGFGTLVLEQYEIMILRNKQKKKGKTE